MAYYLVYYLIKRILAHAPTFADFPVFCESLSLLQTTFDVRFSPLPVDLTLSLFCRLVRFSLSPIFDADHLDSFIRVVIKRLLADFKIMPCSRTNIS